MKRVRIDFAARSLRRTLFHTPRLAWVLLGAGICLSVPAALVANQYVAEERSFEAELAARNTRAATPLAAQAAVRAPAAPLLTAAQASAVNAAILQLNLPWRDLHDAIKAATPASVALLALEPDAKRRVLRVTAEARSSDDMLAYVERMQNVAWFAGVALTRHEINDQDPNRPIRFQFEAQWRPQ
ncbi:PilN domain-containing protein [Massilia sp. CMS3.1]|uniref:PilN domain-containing protein n=1 Tax=Massilia sp. CMS3.1 TaxID=3373083 RepID=UPI003EE7AC66